MQFFHVIDRAVCTVISYEAKEDKLVVQLALANTGNRPLLLKDARLQVRLADPRFSGATLYWDDPTRPRNINGPKLIGKGEIFSFTVSFHQKDGWVKFLAELADEGRLPDLKSPIPFYARLNLVTGSGRKIDTENMVIGVCWQPGVISYSFPHKDSWAIGTKFVEVPDVI